MESHKGKNQNQEKIVTLSSFAFWAHLLAADPGSSRGFEKKEYPY